MATLSHFAGICRESGRPEIFATSRSTRDVFMPRTAGYPDPLFTLVNLYLELHSHVADIFRTCRGVLQEGGRAGKRDDRIRRIFLGVYVRRAFARQAGELPQRNRASWRNARNQPVATAMAGVTKPQTQIQHR